ncbi:Protein of unknown function, partial [Gryllus bimaculatus]
EAEAEAGAQEEVEAATEAGAGRSLGSLVTWCEDVLRFTFARRRVVEAVCPDSVPLSHLSTCSPSSAPAPTEADDRVEDAAKDAASEHWRAMTSPRERAGESARRHDLAAANPQPAAAVDQQVRKVGMPIND